MLYGRVYVGNIRAYAVMLQTGFVMNAMVRIIFGAEMMMVGSVSFALDFASCHEGGCDE